MRTGPPGARLGAGCSASEAGSYLRLVDSYITQPKVLGPSRTCNESKEEEAEARAGPGSRRQWRSRRFRRGTSSTAPFLATALPNTRLSARARPCRERCIVLGQYIPARQEVRGEAEQRGGGWIAFNTEEEDLVRDDDGDREGLGEELHLLRLLRQQVLPRPETLRGVSYERDTPAFLMSEVPLRFL